MQSACGSSTRAGTRSASYRQSSATCSASSTAFLFYLVAAIAVWSSPKRQRIGDRAAATVVVHDRGEFRESVQSRRPAYDLPEYPRADDSTVYAQERFLEDLARAKCFGD
jgi:hypothetical protein